jgi:uncharacterized protein
VKDDSAAEGGYAAFPELARGRGSRLRALGWFVVAMLYTVFASQAAERLVAPLTVRSTPVVADLARVLVTVPLLLAGYAAMALAGQGQRRPLRDMGLALRPGAALEWGLGAALGWAGVLLCVVPIAAFGELILQVTVAPPAWLGLAETLVFLALGSLGEEICFRGYPFQRLLGATGPATATVVSSSLYAAAHLGNPGASSAAFCTTFLLGVLFSMAYLRTRGLWLGWGLHFAWNASTAVLFGLPLSGLTGYSPVVSSYTRGPVWLTGGGYGPENSAWAVPVVLVLMIVLARVSMELKHRWATPPIVAGGYPVDLEAQGRAQHARAMGEAPAAPPLVQIQPGTPAPRVAPSDEP